LPQNAYHPSYTYEGKNHFTSSVYCIGFLGSLTNSSKVKLFSIFGLRRSPFYNQNVFFLLFLGGH
jgi:hypothetical protein